MTATAAGGALWIPGTRGPHTLIQSHRPSGPCRSHWALIEQQNPLRPHTARGNPEAPGSLVTRSMRLEAIRRRQRVLCKPSQIKSLRLIHFELHRLPDVPPQRGAVPMRTSHEPCTHLQQENRQFRHTASHEPLVSSLAALLLLC